ncbi:hypothetical protein ABPG73_020207 [Tetrahymena malaccensis]
MIFSEKQKRLLQVFFPYIAVLLAGTILLSLLTFYFYQTNLQIFSQQTNFFIYENANRENNLRDYALERYQDYLSFMSYSEKIFLTLQYQKITSFTQRMGILTQELMSDQYLFDDIGKHHQINHPNLTFKNQQVAWDDKTTERYSNGYTQANFLISSAYQMQDYCSSYQKCGQNQTCQINYDNSTLQLNYMDDQVQYEKAQYSTFSYQQSAVWQNLTQAQKQYLIKMDLNKIFMQVLVINKFQDDIILPKSIYSASQKDGINYSIFLINTLSSFPIINNSNYGGPFGCNSLLDGKYKEYKYTSVDQFNAFQYQDIFGQTCGNATHLCTQCIYYNQKRLFPIDWRCRPWYQSANNSFYISFGQPYINLNPLIVISTQTFKVVLQKENMTSIYDEYNDQQDIVIALDIDLTLIADRYQQNNDHNIEYQYLIATNPSKTSDDYSPLVIAHPDMNNTVIQTIYEVEYSDSQNTDLEIELFKNQTQFLNQPLVIDKDCIQQMKQNNSQIRKITKNSTLYLAIFAPIYICYGNLYEQASTINTYFVKYVSYQKIEDDIYQVTEALSVMIEYIIISYSSLVVIVFIFFYHLTKYFLIYNFEIPIQILTQFIQNADCQSIFIFNQKIEKQELKTSSELKNLIAAINKVVLKVQEKVQQKFLQEESDQSYFQIQKSLVKQLITFQTFNHQTGIGMCLNNLSVLSMLQKKLKQALNYMNQSNQVSNQMLQELVQPFIEKRNISYNQAINILSEDKNQINFLKICACRKYQQANLLFHYCKYLKKGKINKENDEIQLSTNSNNSFFKNMTYQQNNSSPINQHDLKDFKESFFYTSKYYANQFHTITQSDYIDENKSLQEKDYLGIQILKAKDLIYEASTIFQTLSLSPAISQNERDKLIFEQQLKDYVIKRYNMYLDFSSYSERIIISSQFQKITSITQTLGTLVQDLMDSKFNFDQLISWDDKQLERYSNGQNKANFLVMSGYQMKDYCSSLKFCYQNQTCIDNYDDYNQQLYDFFDYVQHEKMQFSTWTYQMANDWEQLNNEQKQFIVKMGLQQGFVLSYIFNQQDNIIQATGLYMARDLDGILFQTMSYDLLIGDSILNQPQFGGPFECRITDGSYPEYIYTNTSQFYGFQYQDDSGETCGNATIPCSCPYYNLKRLTPVDWRCRPWYQQSEKTLYITYTQPYVDIISKTICSTSTFKAVQSRNFTTSIIDQENQQQDAVFGTDIDLKNLLLRFASNEQNIDYSYLVSTNIDPNITDFIPYVIAHPQMNFTEEQTILEVEFQDSLNQEFEIQKYKNLTNFLMITEQMKTDCQPIPSVDIKIITITKNNQDYLTRFTPIQICFGTLNEQFSLYIAYYAKAISLQKIDQDIQSVTNLTQIMLIIIPATQAIVLFIIILVFYSLLKYFLQFNFEIPIKIVSEFIKEADSKSIYIFNERAKKGLIKTSQELRNLIFTINEIVFKVQESIQKIEKLKQTNYSDKMEEIYINSILIYEQIAHYNGIALCLNNMAGINLLHRRFTNALQFMSQCDKINNQILDEITKPVMEKHHVNQQEAINILQQQEKIEFFKLYACRKYQLANILYQLTKQIIKNSKDQNILKSKIIDQSEQDYLHSLKRKDSIYFENIQDSIIIKELQQPQNNNSFYSKKFQQKFQNSNLNNILEEQQNQECKIKMYTQQAKDLIYEANTMFQQIAQSQNTPLLDKNKLNLYQALCYLLLDLIQSFEMFCTFQNIEFAVYDSKLALKSLKLLQKIIQQENIQITQKQKTQIQLDIKELRQTSQDNFQIKWEDQLPQRFSQGYDKSNFLIANGYQLIDYCKPITLCSSNQTCIDNYDNYFLQLNYLNDEVQYQKAQYSTWTYQMTNDWQDLNDLQKKFIVKISMLQVFGLAYILNQQSDIIQTTGIYLARQEDGILFEVMQYNLLVDNSQLSIPEYGGPFECNKINGSYPEYIYSNVSQFNGFQYQDDSGNTCGDINSPCECLYFNLKRLTPYDWRCRPWYQQAGGTFFVCDIYIKFQKITKLFFNKNARSYSQPYIDISFNSVCATSTFKVVLSNNKTNSIEGEMEYQQDAVLGADIDLTHLQYRFMKNMKSIGYSYLLSTNVYMNSTDFSPLIFAHPDMSQSIKHFILKNQFQTEYLIYH